MRRIISIFILLSALSSSASDSLTYRNKKLFVDVSYGIGGFSNRDGSSYLNSGPSIKYNSVRLINSVGIDVSYGLIKKDSKVRKGLMYYLSIGFNLRYFNYHVQNVLPNNFNYSVASPVWTEYDKNSLDYTVSIVNSGITLQTGILCPNGFFIWNSVGAGYAAFMNKTTLNYSEHVHGNILHDGPSGYYYEQVDYTNYYTEKNYGSNIYILSYQLNPGWKIKNFAPFISVEENIFLKKHTCDFRIGRVGLRIMF